MPELDNTDTYGWVAQRICECDRCHLDKPTCAADYRDGSGDWDYCQECWRKLSQSGAFDNIWI